MYSKIDSQNIQYELDFDLFTREFCGFTMYIDKNTYTNIEINGDNLPHCE